MDSYFSFYCRRAAQRAGPVQSGWLTWPPSGDRIEMRWLVREECPVPLIYGTLLHRSPAAAWLGLRRRMAAFMWTSARCWWSGCGLRVADSLYWTEKIKPESARLASWMRLQKLSSSFELRDGSVRGNGERFAWCTGNVEVKNLNYAVVLGNKRMLVRLIIAKFTLIK